MIETEQLLDDFIEEVTSLGSHLGCLLVQLPPRLEFDLAIAQGFLATLRRRYAGAVAIEPRHPSWFSSTADGVLRASQVARVAADPPRCAIAREPAGWEDPVYYRLHGSPRVYFSAYDDLQLDELSAKLAAHARNGGTAWCIFDNTGAGAATINALALLQRLQQ